MNPDGCAVLGDLELSHKVSHKLCHGLCSASDDCLISRCCLSGLCASYSMFHVEADISGASLPNFHKCSSSSEPTTSHARTGHLTTHQHLLIRLAWSRPPYLLFITIHTLKSRSLPRQKDSTRWSRGVVAEAPCKQI